MAATGIVGSRHSRPGRELNHNKLIHWEIRAFRALTRLYPRSFRAAYEREVIDFFVQERGQKSARPRSASRHALDVILDGHAVRHGRDGNQAPQADTNGEGLPGVGGASWITTLPFTTDGVMSRVTLERSTGELDVEDFLPTTSVSPSFFQTAGLRILHGRGLGRDDCAEAPTVAVVNEAFVQQYWPDEPSVLGLQFWYGDRGDGDPVEVAGVVEDMAYRLNSDPLPQLLVAMAQSLWGHATLVVRTAGEPVAMLEDLKSITREARPNLPLDLSTLEALYREELVRPRFYALLIGSFAGLAGLLALVGLYGTVSYSVQRRTRELGIRIALGAQAGTLVRSVLRGGVTDAMLGIALGVAASLLTTRLIPEYLFQVEPTDALTFASTAGLLLVASLLAAWIPARRVARVDPQLSLSSEA